jgi:hypothetical protein
MAESELTAEQHAMSAVDASADMSCSCTPIFKLATFIIE